MPVSLCPDRRVMRVSLIDKGRAMREPLDEMWSALEQASVGDLDAGTVEQFIATSAVIRRAIVDRDSPTSTHIQPVVTDGGGQTHN
ncbi:MAG: hypothetical protein LC781_09635 [Actinobacteria bacterium]|nr:hypothetical protein [Actinomycetota bacterium]